ncbi:unnamed protein product [Hermetia illucens]|uniref:Uncharacterized protein n=1 Tax=Hermetia illucens TaxID=343691 RepID=A0A7R8UGB5_HERIL|nr:ragulator complex protein LAMTOR3 homolog [Hermetia illucens]CAD7080049.1 unnamed protein product [Hermetia illucens]
MTDDVKRYFTNLLQKVSGLFCILVTDRDGVPLIRIDNKTIEDIDLPPSLFSTFALATDQAGKLGLGKNKTIISMYSNYQIVQMNKLPLIVTFVGTENCNTGHILALEKSIDGYLDEIKLAVTES